MNPIKKDVTIGDCRLILGDCLEVMPLLYDAANILTDPPYGIGISANPVRQKHKKKQWDTAVPSAEVFTAMSAASRQQIIWGGNYFDLPPSQCFLVWDKVQPQDFSLAMCEMAWASFKSPAKLYRRRVVGYEKHHPTQKPVELMEWCLGFLPSYEATLDPFMGSGTTLVACAKLGRRGIGIELDPDYFEIACERVRKAYAQPDLFIEAAKAQEPVQEGLDI
jgi:DNA modification methylase